EHVRITFAELRRERRHVLRELMTVRGIVGDEYLRHTADRCCLLRSFGASSTGDENVHVPSERLGCGEDVASDGFERRVVVLCDDECAHEMTFASLRSFCTSSSTVFTLMPALRDGGASTDSPCTVGVTSTPSAAGVVTSSVFFFAFMMFGNDA